MSARKSPVREDERDRAELSERLSACRSLLGEVNEAADNRSENSEQNYVKPLHLF
jgi:hypothetical protein